MSDRDLNERPPRAAANTSQSSQPPILWIGTVLLAMLALPVGSYLTGSTIGAFRMFTQLARYRVSLEVLTADGTRSALPLARLTPHLGRDAQRVLLPGGQHAFGETAASLIAGGLVDLARLSCELSPGAIRARAQLSRVDPFGRASVQERELLCDHGQR